MASTALGILATDLANAAALAAAGRLSEAAFAPAQERKLKELLGESLRVMLERLTRSGELAGDSDYIADLRIRLTNFFSVGEVAEALVAVAVDSEPLPVGRLRVIYEGRGNDANVFPATFEGALNECALHLARRVREEASTEGSPLNNLVEVSKLYGLEGALQEVLRRTASRGATVGELERESWARCKRRWTVLGVPPEDAEALAKNPTVGAPSSEVRQRLGRPVAVITAVAGAGKSLLLDGLMQRAIVRYRENDGAPLPAFLEATEVNYGCPKWSPDGTKILFFTDAGCGGAFQGGTFAGLQPDFGYSDVGGRVEVINANGSGQKSLTGECIMDADWSPDGTRIVYSDAKYWHLGGIYRMNADGTNKVSLKYWGWADPWGFSGMVDWSTDGSKLVFQQTGEGVNGLWTLDAADGSDLTRVSSPPQGKQDYNPAWQTITTSLPPLIADAGGPYTANEGAKVALDASQSSPYGDITSYSWDLDGDGEYDDATGAAAEVTFEEQGTFTVSVEVTHRRGHSETDSATVTVGNVAPAVSGASASVDEDGLATLSARFTDPGIQDSHSAVVNWGDGSAPEVATVVRGEGGGTVMASHRYPPGGGGSTGGSCSPSPVGSLSLLDGTSTLPGGSLPPPDSCSPLPGGPGGFPPLPGGYRATVSVTDDDGGRGSATAGVQTLPADRAPVATNRTVATDQDVPADVTLDASDPDGNTLMYELVSSPSHGQVVLTPPGSFIPGLTPDLIYFPDPGYSGEDSFTFKASDGRLESNVASVSISVSSTNGAPDAQNDAATTDEGTPVVIDVLANDTDPDGDTLVVESMGDPAHGTAELIADGEDAGKVRYVPDPGHSGPDSFSYTVSDGNGTSDTATVDVTVNPTNDPPTADAGGPYEVNEGGSVEVGGSGEDPEGGALTFDWDLDGDGSFETPGQRVTFSAADLDGPGSHEVKVQVTDPDGASAIDGATVEVKNVAPSVVEISGPSRVLTGGATNAVPFTATAEDPSAADKNAGFTWEWAVDGGTFSPGPNPFSTTFSACGEHTLSAKAADKDGQVSEPLTSDVVSVHEAHYQHPLDEGAYNLVQKGAIVPVKISIAECGGGTLTGLEPTIGLLKGDRTDGTEKSSDVVETLAPSADTTGIMRPVEGGYIYNLRVPTSIGGVPVVADNVLTIRIRPFGDDNPGASMYVLLKIRK